jgi:hypothetical protein
MICFSLQLDQYTLDAGESDDELDEITGAQVPVEGARMAAPSRQEKLHMAVSADENAATSLNSCTPAKNGTDEIVGDSSAAAEGGVEAEGTKLKVASVNGPHGPVAVPDQGASPENSQHQEAIQCKSAACSEQVEATQHAMSAALEPVSASRPEGSASQKTANKSCTTSGNQQSCAIVSDSEGCQPATCATAQENGSDINLTGGLQLACTPGSHVDVAGTSSAPQAAHQVEGSNASGQVISVVSCAGGLHMTEQTSAASNHADLLLEVGGGDSLRRSRRMQTQSGGRVWNTAAYRDLWSLALAVGESQAEASTATDPDGAGSVVIPVTSASVHDGFTGVDEEASEPHFTIGTAVAAIGVEQQAAVVAGGKLCDDAVGHEPVPTSVAVPVRSELQPHGSASLATAPVEKRFASRDSIGDVKQQDSQMLTGSAGVNVVEISEGSEGMLESRGKGGLVSGASVNEGLVCSSLELEGLQADSDDDDLRDPMARYTISSVAKGSSENSFGNIARSGKTCGLP